MKLKKYFHILAAILLVAACEDNDTFTTSQSDLLSFSVDTVRIDTVFSNVSSSTRSFWVFNHSGAGIRCSSIRLERGNQSGFRANVDGTYLSSVVGYQVRDVEIRAGDSIRVYVELTAPRQHADDPQKLEENLVFNLESGAMQKVCLAGWAWDAALWRDVVVTKDSVISSPNPIVVHGGITVNKGATLTIASGTTLYFANTAGIQVDGTLKTEGTADRPVVLRGDRIDRMFDYLPYDRVSGQWRGIRFGSDSYGNELKYTDLHGAFDGIVADSSKVDSEKLHVFASTIHNCQGVGLQLNHCKARLDNTLISNALKACLEVNGGDVVINGCTLAQFYPFDTDRGAAIRFRAPLQNLLCRNSLITGYADDVMMGEAGDLSNYRFENCIVRTPEVVGTESVRFSDVLFENPKDTLTTGKKHFERIDTENLVYDFQLDAASPAIGKANAATSLPTDRNGRARDEKPDIGAFERK